MIYPPSSWNVIAMGTVVQALWSLLSEFATEYDVINPEGISVPVRQPVPASHAAVPGVAEEVGRAPALWRRLPTASA